MTKLSPAQQRVLRSLAEGDRSLSGVDLRPAGVLRRLGLARPVGKLRFVTSLNGGLIREQRWTLTLAGRRVAEGAT